MSYAYKLNEDVRHQPQGPQELNGQRFTPSYSICPLSPMDGLGTASSASPRGSSESLRRISFRTFSDLQRLIDRENVLRARALLRKR